MALYTLLKTQKLPAPMGEMGDFISAPVHGKGIIPGHEGLAGEIANAQVLKNQLPLLCSFRAIALEGRFGKFIV
jgi:hypothetical protein